jgi:hypothetical protein
MIFIEQADLLCQPVAQGVITEEEYDPDFALETL